MDYQSFQPNLPAPQVSQKISPVQKTFTPKFTWVIVVLLVLGGVVYAGIWYWQNQQSAQIVVPTITPRSSATATLDITADWKTFANSKYGINFKYPSKLILAENPFGDRSEMGISLEILFYNQGGQRPLYSFQISNVTMAQMLASRKMYKISDIMLGDQPAKKDVIPALKDGDYSLTEVYATTDFGIFYANSSIGDDTIFDQILSTFKFTPPISPVGISTSSSTDPTTNWNTFSNTQFKYNLKYSKTWYLDDTWAYYGFSYLTETQSSGGSISLKNHPKNSYHPESPPSDLYQLSLQVMKPSAAITVDQLTESYAQDATTRNSITINGLKGLKIYKKSDFNESVFYVLKGKEWLYVFTFRDNSLKAATTFDAIIKTFSLII